MEWRKVEEIAGNNLNLKNSLKYRVIYVNFFKKYLEVICFNLYLSFKEFFLLNNFCVALAWRYFRLFGEMLRLKFKGAFKEGSLGQIYLFISLQFKLVLPLTLDFSAHSHINIRLVLSKAYSLSPLYLRSKCFIWKIAVV